MTAASSVLLGVVTLTAKPLQTIATTMEFILHRTRLQQEHLSTSSILTSYNFQPLDFTCSIQLEIVFQAPYTITLLALRDITGSLLALGLTRTPDIRVTGISLLSYYNPRLYRSEYTAEGTSRLVVLQLGLVEGRSERSEQQGQFSIIAAMFVAVILISSVMMTYSSIRYGGIQDEPQILSAIDETNLALKQVLGFTVGYYGSVLQVTGNSSYARTLANKYLKSGLENVANIRPEWGSSFNVVNLSLSNNWFMNASYSKGTLTVNYSLTGLGVSGVTYSASCRLDVQISPSSSSSQVCLTVLRDENQSLNDLGKQNFKFYRYRYSNLTWEMVSPSSEPVAFSNGTYLVDVPPGINPYSYIIQVAGHAGDYCCCIIIQPLHFYACCLTAPS